MVQSFDHVTVVVRDVDAAQRFFRLLGFEHERTVTISGDVFADYMGVPAIEAEHVTLVLAGAVPRAEVQLLAYRRPDAVDTDPADLRRIGLRGPEDVTIELSERRPS
ncbi:MAG TPA: hypothetical protein VFW74_00510 [Acidimicrobiia bacterium]|nr:hypothetical protein [Acidimicrobiia bacterium]